MLRLQSHEAINEVGKKILGEERQINGKILCLFWTLHLKVFLQENESIGRYKMHRFFQSCMKGDSPPTQAISLMKCAAIDNL